MNTHKKMTSSSVPLEKGFICLHVGAGYHCPSKIQDYKKLCAQSCRLGARLLNEGKSCVEVVEAVMCRLEDSDLTNAGYGSNLTMEGTVECEAAIMESKENRFAAVTCVKSLRNPIKTARLLLDEQLKPTHSELLSPMVLAGDGVISKAISHGIPSINTQQLISPKARRDYEKYMRILNKDSDESIENPSAKRFKVDNDGSVSKETTHSAMQDTIGVICVDSEYDLATAVSSGGIVLKHPGRVGPSAHIGSGCWAYKYEKPNCTVACCTSGSGEPIIRTNLARMVSDYIACETEEEEEERFCLNDFMDQHFVNSDQIPTFYDERHCGLLLVKLAKDDDEEEQYIVDFYLAHTTQSFCVAYLNSKKKRVSTIVSTLDVSSKKSIVTQGYSFRL